jgi:hypothetical protein
MKTAILITGQYRPHVNNKKAKQLIALMEKVFKTHMFFHTWSDAVTEVPVEYHDRLVYCKEPEVDYHPVSDVSKNGYNAKHGKWELYTTKRLLYNKMANANKQMLAYADLLSKIPDDFDVLIRMRWDILVSDQVDFKPYLKKAYEEGPVGFMTRPIRKHDINQLIELPKEDTHQEQDFIMDDWYGYLPDNMIMHRREHFDLDLVKKLHEEKKLAAAEWGWYQIMSEPYGDIHTSVHGGARIRR